jgi:hypothetical protein
MNSRWGFVIASILIPVVAIFAGLASKEIRCFVRLESGNVCQTDFINVELIVQDENDNPIEDVEVRFISKGAPEVLKTDVNGYTTIQIPSRGDIEIILSKIGFENQRQIVNLATIGQNRTKTYRLQRLVSQPSPSVIPLPTDPDPSTFPNPSIQPRQPENPQSPVVVKDNDYEFQLQNCIKKSSTEVICNFLITNLTNSDNSLGISNKTRAFDSSGIEYLTTTYALGSSQVSRSTVGINTKLLQGVPIKSSFTFEVPQDVNELIALELPYWYAVGNIAEWSEVKFGNIKISSN